MYGACGPASLFIRMIGMDDNCDVCSREGCWGGSMCDASISKRMMIGMDDNCDVCNREGCWGGPMCVAPRSEFSLDSVNHPSHYNSGKFEVIDVIHDWSLKFDLGNAVKYIARAGKKDASKYVEDLRKAIFYIEDEIKRYEEKKDKV